MSKILDFLKRLISKKAHPLYQPYVPQPPQQLSNPSGAPYSTPSYSEEEHTIHEIHGTNVKFLERSGVVFDDINQSSHSFNHKVSFLLGSGRVVNRADEIGGICFACQAQAQALLLQGLISPEQASLQSLYDRESGVLCELCGRWSCRPHCQLVNINSEPKLICVACQQSLIPSKPSFWQKLGSLLAAVFVEEITDDEVIDEPAGDVDGDEN